MIGLNYTYYPLQDNMILKNYLFFFGYYFNLIKTEADLTPKKAKDIFLLMQQLSKSEAKRIIASSSDHLFDSPLIKELLILAYDYEVEGKLFKKKIPSNEATNKKIISIFNSLYKIQYHRDIKKTSLSKYMKNKDTYMGYNTQTFTSPEDMFNKFFSFIFHILVKTGHRKEKNKLQKELQNYTFTVMYQKKNSSFVEIKNNKIVMYMNSKKKTTFYHECTHLLHVMVRKIFSIQKGHFTLHTYNEGAANFFAYNLFENIEACSLDSISLQHIYFPKYSYMYQELLDKGTNIPYKNHLLVKKICATLGYTDDQEINNLYYRFFKFLPFSQHRYLYPKELLYQIGYEKIIHSFRTKDPIQRLAEIILYI